MTRVSRIGAWALALLLVAATSASAVPIVYNPQLEPGVPVTSVNNQAPGNPSNPVGATYFFFNANAGANITVFGDRLSGHYDMSFWVLSGLFTDTNQFGGSFPGPATFSDFGDDEDPPNIAGPFGDPRSVFVAPTSGFFTVAVTNFASSAGPPNPFRLQANGILPSPEPVSMVAFALAGLAGVAYVRRRKQVAIA